MSHALKGEEGIFFEQWGIILLLKPEKNSLSCFRDLSPALAIGSFLCFSPPPPHSPKNLALVNSLKETLSLNNITQ